MTRRERLFWAVFQIYQEDKREFDPFRIAHWLGDGKDIRSRIRLKLLVKHPRIQYVLYQQEAERAPVNTARLVEALEHNSKEQWK